MISLSSLLKGRVGHWRLSAENLKVGNAAFTSDFSAGDDNFNSVRGTLAGNIDGISDGVTSYDNVLRFYASADNDSHYIGTQNITPGLTAGQSYRNAFLVYIPSANTNVDGVRVSMRVGGAYTYSENFGGIAGEWTLIVPDNPFLGVSFSADDRIDLYALKGSDTSFTGANLVTDDLIYVYQFRFLPLLIADLTPYGNHAEMYGGTFTTDRHGRANSAIGFNGTSDHLRTALTLPKADEVTIIASLYGGDIQEIAVGAHGAQRAYLGRYTSKTLGAGLGNLAWTTIYGGSQMGNTWRVGSVRYDNPLISMYIDSIEVYSGSTSVTLETTLPFFIGAVNYSGSPQTYWSGVIDEVWVFGRKLTPAEIVAVSDQYRAGLRL